MYIHRLQIHIQPINQRYLAEGFLGNCADLDVKPAWWKEFITRIRSFLREKFPRLAFTHRDIEGVISIAHRRVRRGRPGDCSSTDLNGFERTYTDNTDGMRFLLAEFSPEERRDITLVLKPFVGFNLDHPDSLYQKYLADRGAAKSSPDLSSSKEI